MEREMARLGKEKEKREAREDESVRGSEWSVSASPHPPPPTRTTPVRGKKEASGSGRVDALLRVNEQLLLSSAHSSLHPRRAAHRRIRLSGSGRGWLSEI